MAEHQWRVIARSIRGASHVRSGKENQDAFATWPGDEEGPPLIVAVSDGHGSATSFRSRSGSRLAVSEAVNVLKQFLHAYRERELPVLLRAVSDVLPRNLVRAWRDAVDDHLRNNPISDDDLTLVEAREGASGRRRVEKNKRLAYGATLLAVVVTTKYIIHVQPGDGDILEVDGDGGAMRPLPRDDRLIANDTHSLCSPSAELEFRTRAQQLRNDQPALVLICTDGYPNSFRDDAGFMQVGRDALDLLRSDGLGIKQVKHDLGTWLTEASSAGSGDDITLALLCRLSAIEKGAHMEEGQEDRPDVSQSCLDAVAKNLDSARSEPTTQGPRPTTGQHRRRTSRRVRRP